MTCHTGKAFSEDVPFWSILRHRDLRLSMFVKLAKFRTSEIFPGIVGELHISTIAAAHYMVVYPIDLGIRRPTARLRS